jgi:hypothetical protein
MAQQSLSSKWDGKGITLWTSISSWPNGRRTARWPFHSQEQWRTVALLRSRPILAPALSSTGSPRVSLCNLQRTPANPRSDCALTRREPSTTQRFQFFARLDRHPPRLRPSLHHRPCLPNRLHHPRPRRHPNRHHHQHDLPRHHPRRLPYRRRSKWASF